MPYLSTLLGKPVTDMDGSRVGRLEDLIAPAYGHPGPEHFPAGPGFLTGGPK